MSAALDHVCSSAIACPFALLALTLSHWPPSIGDVKEDNDALKAKLAILQALDQAHNGIYRAVGHQGSYLDAASRERLIEENNKLRHEVGNALAYTNRIAVALKRERDANARLAAITASNDASCADLP